MNLEEIVVWYQKKIGTYDKQEWEKTIEQKILNSFTNITLKSAKLKTEFIDVDLVRGSSFPKAKPKQSLLTVIRLAIFRYLFLPFYKKWWVSQTSSKIYNIFLILYIGQICNWFIYIKNYNSIDANNNEQIFSISELIIPTIISYILCLIHSFIVSTNSMNNSNTKNKQLFSKNGKLREKIRRRKKIVRNIINVEITAENIKTKYDNNNIHRNETINLIKKIDVNENDNIEKKNLKIIYKKKDDENDINSNDNKHIQKQHQENNNNNNNNEKLKVFSSQQKLVIYNISSTSNNNDNNDVQNNKISSLDNNNYNSNNYQLFDNNCKENDYDLNNSMNCSSSTSSNNNMKKIRNVNWDSPIHNYENNDNSDIIIIDNNDSKNLFNTNNYNCNLTTTSTTTTTITNSKLNEKQNSNNIFNKKLSSSSLSSPTNKLTKTPTTTTTTAISNNQNSNYNRNLMNIENDEIHNTIENTLSSSTTSTTSSSSEAVVTAAPATATDSTTNTTTTTSISSDINGKNQTNNSSSRSGGSNSSSSNCSSNNTPTTYCNNDNSNSSSNSSNNIIINNILNTTIVSSSSLSSSSISIKATAAPATTTTIAANSIDSISSINTTKTTTSTTTNDDDNDLENLLEPFNKDDGFESLNGKSSSGDEDNKYDDNNDNNLNLNNYDLINQQQQQQLSQQQQQDIIYNKKFDIICRKINSNSNKKNKMNSYSSSNDNTPLVQLKLKNQRKKIKFCKNRSLLTSSVNNIINDNHYNYNNNHHHQDNNYENYDSDNDKNDDYVNDDDGDELSDEELLKSNFDKLNKRYSIPLVRNSKRKLPYSETELNNPSSILNLQNAYMKAMSSTTTTAAAAAALIKKSYSSTAEISSMATGTNGGNGGSVAECDIVLGIGGLRRRTGLNRSNESSDIDEDGDDEEIAITNQNILNRNGVYNGCSTSATEWLGITTNSEECSYSSEPNSDLKEDSDDSDHESAPNVLLNSRGSNDRISCTIWHRHDPKKAEMSVLDISSCIIERVEAMPESSDYIYIGVVCSIVLSLIPSLCRLCEATVNWETSTEVSYFDVPILLWEKTSFSFSILIELTFGKTSWEKIILIIGFFERLILTLLLFFLFAVAERTFKQRFLYAKLFSHLTSSRRARKSDLPHFRLNKVRNIKTWLSVRSYLKRRGPQRSVDVIVSTALSITLLLLGFLSVECLKDSVHIHSQVNLEALFWSGALGIYLLRFMTLGNKINRKYRSISVLITEQINLYLQIEQKPKKKDELMVANSVLKLAADLLKELESPFKISGLFANPYLYTTIKVVILSAFSGVLSEMLGFKLKLHKIKIK